MTHALKTLPLYFQAVAERGKTFEVRKADRPFRVGETLLLQEWDNIWGAYTGNEISVTITYILHGGQLGIQEGYVVMGIKEKDY
jgi:hypothetical protein